ncbi:hypothetical protein [Streptomyces sp. SD31]|uniref:hypothetical protein n=1 Tax=Streptomyces sp. SD31 TaxID=3452208 RepID=UPI003F8AA58A
MTYRVRAGGGPERHTAEAILRIEPWGPHAVRVRASAGAIDPAAPGALESPSADPHAEPAVRDDGSAHLVNGRLAVQAAADGRLRFLHAAVRRHRAERGTSSGTRARHLYPICTQTAL